MLEKCKHSQPTLQWIIESTNDDDDAMFFEALNLHDELQQAISKYEEMESTAQPEEQPPEHSDADGKCLLEQEMEPAAVLERILPENSDASGRSSLTQVENEKMASNLHSPKEGVSSEIINNKKTLDGGKLVLE